MPFILFIIAFFFGMRGSYFTAPPGSGPLPPGTAKPDCSYNLETNVTMQVDVFPEKEAFYKDKENTVWARVKKDAFIPAWKVWSGYAGGEMEEIGRTVADNRRVFIGLGHCRGGASQSCRDPLPQTMLFVVNREGAKPPNIPRKDEQAPGFWWDFDAYFDLAKLPANPINDDLPCWIKQCVAGDIRRSTCPAPQNSGKESLTALTQAKNVPSFINKGDIKVEGNPSNWNKVAKIYWFDKEIPNKPDNNWAERLGTVSPLPDQSIVFDVWFSTEGLENLILDPKDNRGKYYRYQNTPDLKRPKAKTLQLGTFSPVHKFLYEWWTPSCKPAIYLYPKKAMEVSVNVKPKGRIIKSIPEHGEEGWQVFAYPDGQIVNLRKSETRNTEFEFVSNFGIRASNLSSTYPYLFYEARLEKIKVPQEGWIVKREELKDFFQKILPQLGLNKKESQDFLSYWLPKLSKGRLWFIGLIDREELDRVEPIEFSLPDTSNQAPDTFIRVRFYFEEIKKENSNNQFLNTKQFQNSKQEKFRLSDFGFRISSPRERRGFTVVDWGGILANGSCGLNEKSE